MSTQRQEQPDTRLFRVLGGLLLTITSLIGAFFLLCIALAKAMQQERLRDRIRQFNRQRLNPATLRIAGKRSRIYASIEHVGRRSGHEYQTPVVARPLGDGFVIPLPYGADTDWCRNVMAAGTCKLRWNEQQYTLERPEIVSLEQVLSAFPFAQRLIFSVGGIEHYLLLHAVQQAPKDAVTSTASL